MSAVIDEMAIDLNNLDKSSWKTYQFDEIAQNISERVDPNNTDLTVYIGLEHLDSGSIHIKRSGTPDDVNGQKLRFYKGDVIFGRRRAYQRKAGVATTDGFCSAHALVLRANPDVIDPELFPFFLHSDLFMNRAVDISVGSLSPTINWGTLRHQEFKIPPVEFQKKLADMFAVTTAAIQKYEEVSIELRKVLDAFINERCLKADGEALTLSKIIHRLIAGVSVNSDSGNVDKFSFGILKTSSVSDGYFKSTEVKRVVDDEVCRLKTSVNKDTIIISRMNTAELVGANAYIDEDYPNLFLPDRLWMTEIVRKDINVKYLWLVLSSFKYRKMISDLCSGTSNSMKNISKKDFLALPFTLPAKTYQDDVVREFEHIEDSKDLNFAKLERTKYLKEKLLNQVF